MKKLIVCMFAFVLSACISLSFDPMEYDRYVTLKEQSDQLIPFCADQPYISNQISRMKIAMDHQYIYEQYRGNVRPNVIGASIELKNMIDEMNDRYSKETPSIGYCQEKLRNISLGATVMMRELGRL